MDGAGHAGRPRKEKIVQLKIFVTKNLANEILRTRAVSFTTTFLSARCASLAERFLLYKLTFTFQRNEVFPVKQKKFGTTAELFICFYYLRFFCKKIGILISCSFGACGVGDTMPGNGFTSCVNGFTGVTGVAGAAGFTGVVILGDAP